MKLPFAQYCNAKRYTLVTLMLLLLNGCDGNQSQATVSYTKDIQPIIKQHCVECHVEGGAGTVASGLNLSSYEELVRGTKFGPIIKAGDSTSSTLVILIEGRADASINMPHGNRPALSHQDTQKIRQWIDDGALNN